ncbi:Htur_1727 family rSAM-partnered candidate RiPP [Natrinema halophilum]|uniref:RSAM-partnered protein n=1 Tax=Natrinema halophilum TaxID=1699371 RepID=A0A7D5KHG5_9EURY|nr:Htur_1727 family rSAM-partnered candidate RiPP [Natrinema halophilum]QLG47619.1 Htur_1727 family rSAM-partnered candidate RiPP [Natrinema halophilum]
MEETPRRSTVPGDERGNPAPQWEVFVRTEAGEPMRHVGSVAAANGTEAHEHASRLFGWYAADVWLCPARAVERYSTRGLADATEERTDEIAVAERGERGPDANGEGAPVSEETECPSGANDT